MPRSHRVPRACLPHDQLVICFPWRGVNLFCADVPVAKRRHSEELAEVDGLADRRASRQVAKPGSSIRARTKRAIKIE